MGEPKYTNNVRRIDFAKAGAKQTRQRADEPPARPQEPSRTERDRLKVVSLPEPRVRRRHRSSEKPAQNAMLAVIAVLAALLGALVAAVFLDPAL